MEILGKRILIEPTPVQEKNGIILATPDNHYGKVIGVGVNQKFIKVGDKVKYFEGRGTEYKGRLFLEEKDVDIIL